MTHKIALSLSLFATLGMTACTVDAPTPEDFNYSFLEELPGGSQANQTFGLRTPAESHITLSFRDGIDGTETVDPNVSRVIVVVEGVKLASLDDDNEVVWRRVSKAPFELNLMTLADGDVRELANGPVPSGEYLGLALGISDAWVVETSGRETPLELPGAALVIKEGFDLEPHDTTALVVSFGGLAGLESHDKDWGTDPVVSLEVDYDEE